MKNANGHWSHAKMYLSSVFGFIYRPDNHYGFVQYEHKRRGSRSLLLRSSTETVAQGPVGAVGFVVAGGAVVAGFFVVAGFVTTGFLVVGSLVKGEGVVVASAALTQNLSLQSGNSSITALFQTDHSISLSATQWLRVN